MCHVIRCSCNELFGIYLILIDYLYLSMPTHGYGNLLYSMGIKSFVKYIYLLFHTIQPLCNTMNAVEHVTDISMEFIIYIENYISGRIY